MMRKIKDPMLSGMFIPDETSEQLMVIAHLDMIGWKYSAIPAETGHSEEARRRAVRMKRLGYRKGLPDLMVVTPSGIVWLEMKRTKRSVTSPEQKAWINTLNATPGTAAYVCKGSQEAIAILEAYRLRKSVPEGTTFTAPRASKVDTLVF